MIYLDYSATSPILDSVKKAMIEAMDYVGNPSALHTPGHLAMNQIEDARAEIAQLINADPSEILFTSGGTESNNTVTNIFTDEKVLVSAIEHPSLLESARLRCEDSIIPVDQYGFIEKDGYRNLLAQEPKLVSVMLANNELGSIQEIAELAKLAHEKGAFFHTDGTQALGKIPVNVRELDVDYMTISAHKIGGPTGIGALFIKKDSPFRPFIIGGHQERGRRAGTYQTVNIVGFKEAAKYTRENQVIKVYQQKIQELRNLLAKRILKEVPYSSINSPLEKKNSCLPHLLNCSFEAAEGESIQLYLDAEAEIIVSTGSACASGDARPSHVIMATRNDAEVAHSSIRFSLGLETTEKDIEKIMQYLPNIVKRLQGISTIKIKGDTK